MAAAYYKLTEDMQDYLSRMKSLHIQYSYNKLTDMLITQFSIPQSKDYIRTSVSAYLKEGKKKYVNIDLIDEPEFELVRTLYEDRKPYVIPLKYNNMLVISDIHIPYHDLDSLKIALRYGKSRNVNTILINGDLIDFYSLSKYEINPSKPGARSELEFARKFLEQLRTIFPNAKIYFKFGNHEFRWARYLWAKADKIAEIEQFELHEVLKLYAYNIEHISYIDKIKFGELNILHGHEIKAGGENIVRNLLQKAKANLLVSNFHRTQNASDRTIENKVIGCWALGCLQGLSPDYLPYNNWNHGFAIIEMNSDGTFHVENKMIIKGQVL